VKKITCARRGSSETTLIAVKGVEETAYDNLKYEKTKRLRDGKGVIREKTTGSK